jgi:hypothetical protein
MYELNKLKIIALQKKKITPFWLSNQQQILVPLVYKILTPLLGPAPLPHQMK